MSLADGFNATPPGKAVSTDHGIIFTATVTWDNTRNLGITYGLPTGGRNQDPLRGPEIDSVHMGYLGYLEGGNRPSGWTTGPYRGIQNGSPGIGERGPACSRSLYDGR